MRATSYWRRIAPAAILAAAADIAQLVEHLIRNEGVLGSSPSTGTIAFQAYSPTE